MITAVDSNVLIDVLEPDPGFGPPSKEALRECLRAGSVVACEVVWAEVTAAFAPRGREVVAALTEIGITHSAVTMQSAMKASECWARCRARSGRTRPDRTGRVVADFLIGGHALVQADRLLTRDRGFYRTWFKPLRLLDPAHSS